MRESPGRKVRTDRVRGIVPIGGVEVIHGGGQYVVPRRCRCSQRNNRVAGDGETARSVGGDDEAGGQSDAMVNPRVTGASSGVEGGELEEDVILFRVPRMAERDRGEGRSDAAGRDGGGMGIPPGEGRAN